MKPIPMLHQGLLLLVIAIVGGALGSTLFKPSVDYLPIVIMDRGAFLQSLEEIGDPRLRRERIEAFEQATRRLADGGFIVIDRGWVLAAPEELYVDPLP
jgi:hypothetical protein